jgi:ribonuclease BN (tRNA processing enzyme)
MERHLEYLKEPELRSLSREIRDYRSSLHDIPFFTSEGSAARDNEFEVLRRWNSDTPALRDGWGGGYYLRWRGKGVVIDPGCTFLDVFRHAHHSSFVNRHSFRDINMVVVTHDHVDHCEDLGVLLVCLRTYNNWLKSHKSGVGREHSIQLVQSLGSHFRFQTLTENHENSHYLGCAKPLPDRYVPAKQDGLRMDGFEFRMKCLRTHHHEVLGEETGFGVRFELRDSADRTLHIVDTGDTAYSEDLLPQYEGADLAVLHVGTLEDMDDPGQTMGRNEHLSFYGVIQILNRLQHPPKLVLLGEWGEEFRVAGYRSRFAECVRRYARRPGMVVLPADLGMRVQLGDSLKVWCHNAPGDDKFVDPCRVHVVDWGQRIEYRI